MIDTLLPGLKNDVVRCVPFKDDNDYEYLFNLCSACKYTRVNKDTIRQVFKANKGYFWSIYDIEKDIKGGVIYFMYSNGKLWLHAYKADSLIKQCLNPRLDYGYQAAKLLIDFVSREIEPVIYTMHSVDNRGATILCKRLGFIVEEKVKTKFGDFIVMRRNHGS